MDLSARFAWSRMPPWVRAVIMFAGYALAAELGNRLSVQDAFSTFWPPAGFAFALLALTPPSEWPVLLVAAAAANVSSDLFHERSLGTAAGFALANCLEAATGAYLVRRFVGVPPRLASRRATLEFGVGSAFIAPAIGATLGATVATLSSGDATWLREWVTWWSGDALSVLVVGGFMLVAGDFIGRLGRHRVAWPTPQRMAGYVALLVTTAVAGAAETAYLGPLGGWRFAIFLPVSLAAAIFGPFGATSVCLGLTLSTSAALAMAQNRVAVASGTLGDEVFVLQAFLSVIAFTSLFLAAAVDEVRATAAAERATAGKYRVLLNTLPIGVTISDENGAIVEASRQAGSILGVTSDEQRTRSIDGAVWRILWPDGTAKPPKDWVSVRSLREQQDVRGQEGVVRPDGSVVWLDVSAAPIPVDGYGVAITYNDITEQVDVRERLRLSEAGLQAAAEHLEELVDARTAELEKTNARLREASAAKSHFLANMSHELRTPLNSVIGFSGVLEQGMAGPLNEEQAREVHMIRTAGRHLLTLVNDLLDLTRIEAGGAQMAVESFAVSGLAEELRGVVEPLAAEKGLEFVISCDPGELVIRSDRVRVSQVLTNLLTNAVKFTESGRVTLECGQDGEDVILRVSDTGIGIPPHEIPKVMEEFYQVDRLSDGMKPAGTGLGLAISKRLVELLGGSLSVETVVGEGTVFTVRLPRAVAPT